MKKPPQIVVVSWIDAQDLPDHWIVAGEHDQEPAVVESVGYLIEPDPISGHMTLACSWHDGVYASGINIPRSCVQTVRNLK